MADSTFSSGAQSSGFVDFYEVLGVSSTAGDDELRTRINDLYNEAQANRNHRQIEKRREYETLLELLPQARNVLLEPSKRERYDTYAAQVARGAPGPDFKTFMTQLSAKTAADPDRVDVLGVADTGGGTAGTRADRAVRKKGPSERARASLIGTAISMIVFFVIVVVTYAWKKDWILAILIGALVGVIAWFLTHRPKDKITA